MICIVCSFSVCYRLSVRIDSRSTGNTIASTITSKFADLGSKVTDSSAIQQTRIIDNHSPRT